VLKLGSVKLHASVEGTRLRAASEISIRNHIAGMTVDKGTGTVLPPWNRIDVRDMAGGVSNQCAVGYVHTLSKRTDLYASLSYTRNGSPASLNAAAVGVNGKDFRAGVKHTF
jgi:predicted porin